MVRLTEAGLLCLSIASIACLARALPTSREEEPHVSALGSGSGSSSDSSSDTEFGNDVEVHTRSQGTFVGTFNKTTGQDQFYGIPYATPPLGQLRFQQTRPLEAYKGDEKRAAKQFGNLCIQTNNETFRGRVNFSEDCLYLNVQRPAVRTVGKKLPVLVFIHGGSWKDGGSSAVNYDPANLIQHSLKLGEPIIHVAMNFRLGVFGNLLGPGMSAADKAGSAALNAAYYDQREALRWIQNNIEYFGGDRDRVTIWGQSSGANGVAAQLLADEGDVGKDCKGCFHNAFLESGSQATAPRLSPTSTEATQAYGALLKMLGCAMANVNSADSVDCLRKVDAASLEQAAIALSGGGALFVPVLDRKFVSELPSSQLAHGKFAKVPIISGDVLDEGTLFASLNLKGNTNTTTFLAGIANLHKVQDEAVLKQIAELYPDEPKVGSPFRPELVGASPDDRFFGPAHQWKRTSAAEGDLLFQAGRRQQIQAASESGVAVYSYLFSLPSPTYVLPGPQTGPFLGIPHGSDIPFLYSNTPKAAPPSSSAALVKYASQKDLDRQSDIFSSALVHFAHTGNPNGKNLLGRAPKWPRYDAQSKRLLQVQGTYNTTIIEDTYREQEIGFILDNAPAFHI
ncbi:Acetylcholinesterase/Butyrylcholinesterase [Ceraceosorus bombacis]|uniref:Carboxylic ester hydrolase n=1 Tax=Ceraceosorus bombacis TaxID=401625 RepID=A0A0P1BFR4_9BASI|nr:Acetylcholinesterase/Butyrylcholinesterase [Ceraceosorus bombacis]